MEILFIICCGGEIKSAKYSWQCLVLRNTQWVLAVIFTSSGQVCSLSRQSASCYYFARLLEYIIYYSVSSYEFYGEATEDYYPETILCYSLKFLFIWTRYLKKKKSAPHNRQNCLSHRLLWTQQTEKILMFYFSEQCSSSVTPFKRILSASFTAASSRLLTPWPNHKSTPQNISQCCNASQWTACDMT